MVQIRKPFQGVWNIIRFNWHFYLFASVLAIGILLLRNYLPDAYHIYISILLSLLIGTTFISLLVSFYIYDFSDLYKLDWLKGLEIPQSCKILNINAGFDETSVLLKGKFPDSELIAYDFYDPAKHTEVSIKRARKAYPPFPDTQQVTTSNFSLQDNYADNIFVILSAHEIRSNEERAIFFREIERVLKPGGNIVVVEHLRDIPNFLAYNIGFLHFISRSAWCNTFGDANLKILREQKITSFITFFILGKHETTS